MTLNIKYQVVVADSAMREELYETTFRLRQDAVKSILLIVLRLKNLGKSRKTAKKFDMHVEELQ